MKLFVALFCIMCFAQAIAYPFEGEFFRYQRSYGAPAKGGYSAPQAQSYGSPAPKVPCGHNLLLVRLFLFGSFKILKIISFFCTLIELLTKYCSSTMLTSTIIKWIWPRTFRWIRLCTFSWIWLSTFSWIWRSTFRWIPWSWTTSWISILLLNFRIFFVNLKDNQFFK